jgi:hypothetical protein
VSTLDVKYNFYRKAREDNGWTMGQIVLQHDHQHEIMNNTSETQAETVCNDNTYPMQLQQIGDFSTVVFKSGV